MVDVGCRVELDFQHVHGQFTTDHNHWAFTQLISRIMATIQKQGILGSSGVDPLVDLRIKESYRLVGHQHGVGNQYFTQHQPGQLAGDIGLAGTRIPMNKQGSPRMHSWP